MYRKRDQQHAQHEFEAPDMQGPGTNTDTNGKAADGVFLGRLQTTADGTSNRTML